MNGFRIADKVQFQDFDSVEPGLNGFQIMDSGVPAFWNQHFIFGNMQVPGFFQVDGQAVYEFFRSSMRPVQYIENLEMGGGLGIDGVVVILDFTGTLRGCCCGRDLSLVLYPTFYCLHGAAPPVGKGRNGQCGRKNCPNNRNVAQNPEHGRSYRIPCNFFRAVSLTALLKVMAFWWYGLIRASTIKGGSQAQCLWT